jgi:hypothetical protein
METEGWKKSLFVSVTIDEIALLETWFKSDTSASLSGGLPKWFDWNIG